jgi:hypothetical protein
VLWFEEFRIQLFVRRVVFEKRFCFLPFFQKAVRMEVFVQIRTQFGDLSASTTSTSVSSGISIFLVMVSFNVICGMF